MFTSLGQGSLNGVLLFFPLFLYFYLLQQESSNVRQDCDLRAFAVDVGQL